jgi:hypothetical protein
VTKEGNASQSLSKAGFTISIKLFTPTCKKIYLTNFILFAAEQQIINIFILPNGNA